MVAKNDSSVAGSASVSQPIYSSTDHLSAAAVRAWLIDAAAQMNENRTWLTELDAPIGDADHGNNMDRGFHAVMDKLLDGGDLYGDDIGALLKTTAMALIANVGGAAGALYGTMFLQASKVLAGQCSLSGDQVGLLLDECVAGAMMQGRAQAGEKTMLDTLIPARDAYHRARNVGACIADALQAAEVAGKNGMQATIAMIARKGRASYLGEHSVGHQDPGASSSYLILQSLAKTAHDEREG